VEAYTASEDREVALMNQLQAETQPPWDGVRFDSFTFRLAMKHMTAAKPRVLYLALDLKRRENTGRLSWPLR
jgi:hypothetical protein